MYNDDLSRQSSNGQFVPRRLIPNPRYTNGGDSKPNSYQAPGSGGYQPPSSYERPERGGGYNSGGGAPARHYGAQRRHDGGGYNSGGGSYRGGGYNSRNSGQQQGPSFDRLVRQNDNIIRLLREIRDRLPAPAGAQQQYDQPADAQYSAQYSGGDSDYAAGGAGYAAGGEDAAYDASGTQGNDQNGGFDQGDGQSGDRDGNQGGDAGFVEAAEPSGNYKHQGQEDAADEDESRYNS